MCSRHLSLCVESRPLVAHRCSWGAVQMRAIFGTPSLSARADAAPSTIGVTSQATVFELQREAAALDLQLTTLVARRRQLAMEEAATKDHQAIVLAQLYKAGLEIPVGFRETCRREIAERLKLNEKAKTVESKRHRYNLKAARQARGEEYKKNSKDCRTARVGQYLSGATLNLDDADVEIDDSMVDMDKEVDVPEGLGHKALLVDLQRRTQQQAAPIGGKCRWRALRLSTVLPELLCELDALDELLLSCHSAAIQAMSSVTSTTSWSATLASTPSAPNRSSASVSNVAIRATSAMVPRSCRLAPSTCTKGANSRCCVSSRKSPEVANHAKAPNAGTAATGAEHDDSARAAVRARRTRRAAAVCLARVRRRRRRLPCWWACSGVHALPAPRVGANVGGGEPTPLSPPPPPAPFVVLFMYF